MQQPPPVKKTKKNLFEGKPGPGRPKGLPNKNTAAVKDMVLQALQQKGGHEYLMRQADENPAAFMSLVGKCLPLDVRSTSDVAITLKDSRAAAAAEFLNIAKAKGLV